MHFAGLYLKICGAFAAWAHRNLQTGRRAPLSSAGGTAPDAPDNALDSNLAARCKLWAAC